MDEKRLEYLRKYNKEYRKRPEFRKKRAEYFKKYREDPENAEKNRVRRRSQYAVKIAGIEAPEACQMCGEIKPLEKHHLSYDSPIDVIYICKQCHTTISYYNIILDS
jgi:hypothetical protein